MQRYQPSNRFILWYLENSDAILLTLAVFDLFFLTLSFFDTRFNTDILIFVWSFVISSIFLFDFIIQYMVTDDKRRYIRENWWQLIIVFLPFLRSLRIFITLRIFVLSYRVRHNIRILLVEKGLAILFAFMLIVALMFGIMVLLMEQADPYANIRSLSVAIWWAFCTMTTVGYGDYVPVTLPGKVVGVVLMFIGLGLVAIFTAQLAAIIIRSDEEKGENNVRSLLKEVATLRAEVSRANSELRKVKQLLQRLPKK